MSPVEAMAAIGLGVLATSLSWVSKTLYSLRQELSEYAATHDARISRLERDLYE
jgi:hypothetical protein